MDLDHFKQINDLYGHHAGDQVLVDFVQLIKAGSRQEDRLFRFGGEEFLLLLPDSDAKGLEAAARHLLQSVRDNLRGPAGGDGIHRRRPAAPGRALEPVAAARRPVPVPGQERGARPHHHRRRPDQPGRPGPDYTVEVNHDRSGEPVRNDGRCAMNRHYYISDNLDDLEKLESELEAGGIATEQIHVLSERDAEVEQHHLHDVPSILKQDIVHSGRIGSLVGLALAALVLLLAWLNDWTSSPAGWIPFLFLAAALFGFSLWEGSLFGLQRPTKSSVASPTGCTKASTYSSWMSAQPRSPSSTRRSPDTRAWSWPVPARPVPAGPSACSIACTSCAK